MPSDRQTGEVLHPDEWPDEFTSYHRAAWECGWCDEWITGFSQKDVHLRLLWHQWFNHRDRIWEEY